MQTETILHVGTEKTGSTSIQNHLEQHREMLLERGVLFPASVFTRKVVAQPERTSGHLQLLRDLMSGDIDHFKAELAEKPHQKLLLSAENILQYPDDAPLEKLKAFLGDAPITVIAVLRRQDHWLQSYYAESVQGGGNREARPFDRFARDILASGMLDYTACLARMARIFKPEQIKVINYDAARRDDGLLAQFAQAANLQLEPEHLHNVRRSHVSIYSTEGLEAHRRLNALGRAFRSKDMHSWTQDMIAITGLDPQASLSKPVLDQATHAELASALDTSNAILTSRYLDNAPFGIGDAQPAPAPQDAATINRFLSEGLACLMRVHVGASSFLKKAGDIPPPLPFGPQETLWLFERFSTPCVVLGLQADALSYLTALRRDCHATFVDADRTRAQMFQMDFDRLELPGPPLFHACPASQLPWDMPGAIAPDIVLMPAHMAHETLPRLIQDMTGKTRVVVYPDGQDGAPAPARPFDFAVGQLHIHDLADMP